MEECDLRYGIDQYVQDKLNICISIIEPLANAFYATGVVSLIVACTALSINVFISGIWFNICPTILYGSPPPPGASIVLRYFSPVFGIKLNTIVLRQ